MPPAALRVLSRRMSSGLRRNSRVGLRRHAIGAAEEREVVHVSRAEIGLERAEDVAQRHVHALRLDAIHVEPELRHVGAKGREVVCQARRLIRLHHHGESLRLQFLETGVAAILNEKAVATGIADPGDGRRRKDTRQMLRESRRERVRSSSRRSPACSARACVRSENSLKGRKTAAVFGLIAAEEVEAGKFHGVEDAGRFARDLRDLVHHGLRAIERRRVGQLRESDGVAAILRREETARHDFETERRSARASRA